MAELREDRKQMHYEKKQPIELLWKEDEAMLLALPATPFEAIRPATDTVNKYGEISVGDEVYHVPKAHHKQRVFIKLHWDKLEIFDEYGETKLAESPRQYAFKAEAIDWAAELEIYRHKPRAIKQATYLKALPAIVKNYLLPPEFNERRKRVSNVITLLEKHSILEVAATIQKGVDYNATDLASLVMMSGYCKASESPKPMAELWTPSSVAEWKPDLTAYDHLSPGGDTRE
ncbi:MAG: hypothetical protein Q7J27_12455 [Syntrophales bacterium]|nr:hypothetical protein [Syntrophales bacterium]